jgi:putative sigma-54 modulation protein
MKATVQFVNTDSSPYVEELLMKKLNKLFKKYDWILKANVFYKLEKDSVGKGKICEIRLSVPGPRIFASSDEESFEKATDETIKDLKRQLKTRKGEMNPHL